MAFLRGSSALLHEQTPSLPPPLLWRWETLGILSQRQGSTSLSLEQQVKDAAGSVFGKEGQLESEKE